jgi:hypothetical protein
VTSPVGCFQHSVGGIANLRPLGCDGLSHNLVVASGAGTDQSLDDYIKIGHTTSVRSRLINLAIANPHPLKVLATIGGDKYTERDLHSRFADPFHRGEWFRKTPELLAHIEQPDAGKLAA